MRVEFSLPRSIRSIRKFTSFGHHSLIVARTTGKAVSIACRVRWWGDNRRLAYTYFQQTFSAPPYAVGNQKYSLPFYIQLAFPNASSRVEGKREGGAMKAVKRRRDFEITFWPITTWFPSENSLNVCPICDSVPSPFYKGLGESLVFNVSCAKSGAVTNESYLRYRGPGLSQRLLRCKFLS